jgi:hypothetical protein
MYRTVIEEIERIQRSRRLSISTKLNNNNGKTKIENYPTVHCWGLYFLYTSYSLTDLQQSSVASTTKAVPISDLANKYSDLNSVLKHENDNFCLVYNGIGGGVTDKYGLRSRILKEISCTSDATGSLCIRQSSLHDLSKWRYSYVTLKQNVADTTETDIDLPWNYEEHSQKLEKLWRLHYGFPLLCQENYHTLK